MAQAAEREPAGPVRLIFDTDICGDVDDVLALGMIHALESRGACKLLAVTVSADSETAGPMVDAVNTFYGRGEIPIGVVRGGVNAGQSKYHPLVHERDGDGPRYPHKVKHSRDTPEAFELLRKVLAAEADASVVIVQVGFSTNLARLLKSPPDEVSPLSGLELVRKKVRLLSIMAGAFTKIDGNARYCEYNVVQDIPSCAHVVEHWPGEIVFSGFEIGIAAPYPAESILRDYGYVKHHPLAEAYILYEPPPHNRPSWDLTSVLFAVYPDRGYFDLSPQGTARVEKDGFTPFAASAAGRHRYLIMRSEQIPKVTEALVQLSSQPPQTHPGRQSAQPAATK